MDPGCSQCEVLIVTTLLHHKSIDYTEISLLYRINSFDSLSDPVIQSRTQVNI